MATKVKKERTRQLHGKSGAKISATAPVTSVPQSTMQDTPKAPVTTSASSAIPASSSAPNLTPVSGPVVQKSVVRAPVANRAPVPGQATRPVAKTNLQTPQKLGPNVQGAPGSAARSQTVTRIVPVAVQPGQTVRVVRTTTNAPSKNKKLLLAAIPGFFGVMGLSQLYQGKRMKGLIFFVTGIIASFLSSWYIIVPSRLQALATHSTQLSPYALSFLSSLNMNEGLASKLSVDLMGVVVAVWALQLFDAMGPFISKQTVAVLTTAVGQKVPMPMPVARRAMSPAPKQPFTAITEPGSSK